MKKLILFTLAAAIMLQATALYAFIGETGGVKKGYNAADVCALAKNEGKVYGIKNDWTRKIIGCTLPGLGMILSLFIMPEVPPGRLIGKPSLYISTYTKCFQEEARGHQFWYAFEGCAWSMLFGYAAYVLLTMTGLNTVNSAY
ncbi:MAG: hypothetical protein LLG37_00035 [Spirochaetia bacterium]|nr:hypothetical protein [Spirochaetia bacterium]